MFSEVERPDVFSNAYDGEFVYLKYDKAPVYYMITQRGEAIELHAGCEGREGKLALRKAGRAVIEWIPKTYPWCKMLLIPTVGKRAYNQCVKLGFSDYGEHIFESGKARVMGISYG